MTTDSSENSTDDCQQQALVAFACHLADAAAKITLPYFRQPLSVDNKADTDFDPVTIADRNAENAMRELIQSHYPSHGILGEEFGARAGSDKLTWVLDPIDGTRAFISGQPTWGTLIALFDGIKPIIGIMDQPFTGERYVASSDAVAGNSSVFLHKGVESSLQTSECMQLSDAKMMSTAPEMFTATEFEAQQHVVSKVRLMRYGSDCYAYCLLAGGHIDLVIEAGLSAYDIQALIPIIENAGGLVTDWNGGSAVNGGRVIAAATKELHQQALAAL